VDLNPFNWFRRVTRESERGAFAAGLAVAREEYKAVLVEDAIMAKRRELEAMVQAISEANQVDASDPAIAAVVEAFKQGVVEQQKIIRGLVNQPILDAQERQEALSAPFVSVECSGSRSASPLPQPTQKALSSPNGHVQTPSPEPSQQPAESKPSPLPAVVKRPRGRPRKYPKPGEISPGSGPNGSSPKS
jgi:hypothetical protein